jgi:glycosyl transferase family 92
MTYLSVCAVYRDEAPYLREWIEFHRLMGAERFYLYDNRSTDDHRRVLAPYVEEGVVVAYEWPAVLPPDVVVGEAAQCATYQHCILNHREDSRWIAFLDLDEFMFSPTGAKLVDVLPEYERWPGVGVNWAQFGTSGHRARPAGLVTESYVRRADAVGYNHWIKSVIDPRRVRNFCLAHFFVFNGEPSVAVDENHHPIDRHRSHTEEVSFTKLRVNHYATKSEEELQRKLSRPRVDNGRPRNMSEGQVKRLLRMTNAVEDRTIQVHLPALKEALAGRNGSR